MQLSWACCVSDIKHTQEVTAAASSSSSSSERISFLAVESTGEPDACSATGSAASNSSSGAQEATAMVPAGDTGAAQSAAASTEASLEAAAAGAKGRSKPAASVAASKAAGVAAPASRGTSGPGSASAGGAAKPAALGGAAKRTSCSGAAAGQQQKKKQPRDSKGAAVAEAEAEKQLQQDAPSQLQNSQQSGQEAPTLHDAAQQGSSGDGSAAATAAGGGCAVPPAPAAVTAAESGHMADIEALLPAGGPSSLLKTLQAMAQLRKQQKQQQQQQQGTAPLSTAAPAREESGLTAAAAPSAFVVEPQGCVVPAGQQQKFTVTFNSWESRVHAVNLVGRQAFAPATGEATHAAFDGVNDDETMLTMAFWPRRQQPAAAAVDTIAGPLELIISGVVTKLLAWRPCKVYLLQCQLTSVCLTLSVCMPYLRHRAA